MQKNAVWLMKLRIPIQMKNMRKILYIVYLEEINLNYGTTQIGKVSGHEINVYGLTQCHHKCARVYLNLSLERKVNGTYETYKTWKFTSNNATNLTKSINVIVPRGYYYRVRGYHAAKDGSKESVTTLTKGILIK